MAVVLLLSTLTWSLRLFSFCITLSSRPKGVIIPSQRGNKLASDWRDVSGDDISQLDKSAWVCYKMMLPSEPSPVSNVHHVFQGTHQWLQIILNTTEYGIPFQFSNAGRR